MNELVWVAAITALGTLLGATVGSVASIFGPSWHERKAREADETRKREDVRYQRAQALADAIGLAFHATDRLDISNLASVRNGFVATLRPGEGQADQFTKEVLDEAIKHRDNSIAIAAAGGSLLFAWLRGDLPISALTLDAVKAQVSY